MRGESHEPSAYEAPNVLSGKRMEWLVVCFYKRDLSGGPKLERCELLDRIVPGRENSPRRRVHGRLQHDECTSIRDDSGSPERTPRAGRRMSAGSRYHRVPDGRRSLSEHPCPLSNALGGRWCRMPWGFASSGYVISTCPAV